MPKLLVLLLLSLIFVPAAYSQTPSSSESAAVSASASAASQPQATPTPVDQLKSDYFYHLEIYRHQAQQYTRDSAEDTKLKTLATREKLTTSTKELLIARANTLRTYLIPLRRQLSDSQGIDIEDKQKALSQIDQATSLITLHHQAIPPLTELGQASTESIRFEQTDLDAFWDATYRALSLLTIGRIQSMSDQVLDSAQDFQSEVLDYQDDARKKAASERGMKEVLLLHQEAATAINQARLSFSSFNASQESQYQSSSYNSIYQTIIKDLNPAYTSLHQALEYLVELDNNS